MAMLLTTTGAVSPVSINDLGARTFSHPTVDLNLELEYQLHELLASVDLRDQLNLGSITLKFDGTNISVAQFDRIARGNMLKNIYDVNEDNVVDISNYASTSGFAQQTTSFYLNRSNHTGTQTAATISDFTSSVQSIVGSGGGSGNTTFSGTAGYALDAAHAYLADISNVANTANFATSANYANSAGTSGYALNAATAYNASLLNSQNASYYLNRTNHTGTQTAASISDFISTSRGAISVAAGSSSYLQYNNTTGVLSIAALAIATVTVNNVATNLANFVAVNYPTGTEFQVGDVVILTAVPTGAESYIHNGGTAGTIADFTLIEGPNLSDTYIRSLFGTTTPLQYNPVTGNFSIPQANSVTSGFLSSSNWNTFNNKQNGDATLDALAGFNSNGIITQISQDSFVSRSIVGNAGKISVTNGDGINGNPTINIGNEVVQNSGTNIYADFDQVFRSTRLKITNPLNTFNYSIVGAAINANRNITLPLLNSDDTLVTQAFTQTLTNKTISGLNNTITRIAQWVINAGVNSTNVTNRYADWTGGIAMNLSPYIVPMNARITHVTAASALAQTWNAEVRVNGVAVANLSLTNADSAISGLISFDVNAGDKITLYINGTSINRPTINVHFSER
jgi:hypothetical protein